MGKMSQLHAETAQERADSAESDLAFTRDALRAEIAKVRKECHAICSRIGGIYQIADDLDRLLSKAPEATPPTIDDDATHIRMDF